MNQRLDIQYYEILGVSPSASLEEVESAYKKACEIYSQNNPEFSTSFNIEEALELKGWVDEAYQIIAEKLRKQTSILESKLTKEKISFQFEQDASAVSNHESVSDLCDGLFLKKLRLKQNISLNYISNKTCIGIHHLIAIEANDFNSLPAPVFVRSYVKQIARILNLDAKKVAENYMRLYGEARGEF